jgi:hypothetical protein
MALTVSRPVTAAGLSAGFSLGGEFSWVAGEAVDAVEVAA